MGRSRDFWNARRDSSGQAPSAETTPGAVVQVYAARAVGWRGVVGVHTWIAVKRRGAAWHRYEVIGWGVDQGAPAVRVVILIQAPAAARAVPLVCRRTGDYVVIVSAPTAPVSTTRRSGDEVPAVRPILKRAPTSLCVMPSVRESLRRT
ncbi:MAG: DUF3750 domain-containing protein [Candidatus Rokubacteria bacterium]|nr:DUF3750 domain-containing protein [Candidatus Rokubacteria bacterium]